MVNLYELCIHTLRNANEYIGNGADPLSIDILLGLALDILLGILLDILLGLEPSTFVRWNMFADDKSLINQKVI